MKKVLVITTWFPNVNEPARCIFNKNIIDAQANNPDYRFTVICPVPFSPGKVFGLVPQKFRRYESTPYRVVEKNYEIFYPRYFKLPGTWSQRMDWYAYYKAVMNTIRKEKLEFDVIHSHGLFPDSYVAARVGEYFSRPLVMHLHDSFIDSIYKKHRKKINYALRRSKGIIPVSCFQASLLKKTIDTNVDNKISVIYNGIDLNKFHTADVKQSEVMKVVFIGSPYKQKGLPSLISAIRILKPTQLIHLDVYGEGNDKADMLKLIEEAGIAGQIHFKGSVPNDVVAEYLPTYKMLILPSLFETFGIVLIEAMACGIPVIASRVTAIPEIVSDDKVGLLVSPGNSEELADAIEKALKINWDKRYIHNHATSFSIVKTANQINDVYNAVING
jgi:glycosyltransferase involved in cell wall biosynthesis